MVYFVKKIFYILLCLCLLILFFFFWQVWQNNRSVENVAPKQIQTHFQRTVGWLDANYKQIENEHNPILWWMVKQAAKNSHNTTLNNLYIRYKKDYLDKQPANLSTPMFDTLYRPHLPDILTLSWLQPYQLFFFYALSCDKNYANEPIIQRQMKPGFCTAHFLHPRCVTHQLMGLRFMQRYQCGYDKTVNHTIAALQHTVIKELTWDFRVTDAYIQRVLMLVDTGAIKSVKPVWIKNILQAQSKDGSWGDLYPIIPLGKNKALGLTSTYPKIGHNTASFHTTAQGLWLLSLLNKKTVI